eukprot:m.193400 g.193400  ORF g.193400 m.193400 type:complete len:62 (-) comp18292_c0_seq4:530-715(-)
MAMADESLMSMADASLLAALSPCSTEKDAAAVTAAAAAADGGGEPAQSDWRLALAKTGTAC